MTRCRERAAAVASSEVTDASGRWWRKRDEITRSKGPAGRSERASASTHAISSPAERARAAAKSSARGLMSVPTTRTRRPRSLPQRATSSARSPPPDATSSTRSVPLSPRNRRSRALRIRVLHPERICTLESARSAARCDSSPSAGSSITSGVRCRAARPDEGSGVGEATGMRRGTRYPGEGPRGVGGPASEELADSAGTCPSRRVLGSRSTVSGRRTVTTHDILGYSPVTTACEASSPAIRCRRQAQNP